MEKIPPQADTPQVDTPPTPWTEKDFAEHWTSKGRAMLTSQEWEITLWLSGLPPEDYQERRQYLAAGLGMKPATLDALYKLTFDEAREFVMRLPQEDFEDQRIHLSKWLGYRLNVLDGWRAEAKQAAKTLQQDRKAKAPERERQGSAVTWPEPELWADPVNGAALLDEMVMVIETYVSLSSDQAAACALWSTMTWLHSELDISAFLHVTSATKRCGKSLLAGEVVPAFLYRPLPTSGRITEAALFRIVEQHHPALVIDEFDTFLRNSPELQGLINGSHRRAGAFALRCEGDDHLVRQFKTFSPKLLCGIGKLEDTIQDRAIRITLTRRPPGGTPLPLWRDRDRDQIETLQRKIARWIGDNRESILQDRGQVSFPPTLDDRSRDCWESLLSIANKAGGLWKNRAYAAAEELSRSDIDEDSARELLIHHVKDIFTEMGDPPAIHTKDLLGRLVEIEGAAWGDWKQGRPLSDRGLSSLLRDFGIKSRDVRIAETVKKGYRFEDFEAVWVSYSSQRGGHTPILAATTLQTNGGKGFSDSQTLHSKSDVAARNPLKPSTHATCSVVADGLGGDGGSKKERTLFTDQSHESREHVTAAFGVHLGEIEPEEDGFLRKLLIDLEAKIASGELLRAEAQVYMWDSIFFAVKPPSLNRWWTTPVAELSAARLSELESGRLLPPGILDAEAWREDRNESGPEDITHSRRKNGKLMGPPTN